MPRNSFIQMTKLHNVRGRIYYISSPKKQENLYAVYETTERSFWSDLAKCNHAEFKKSGTEGKCIEARELIIALPESFTEYPPDKLLQIFTDHFRQTYGTDCIAALHHNKRKTNYHIHLIFSERTLLEQPIEKVATLKIEINGEAYQESASGDGQYDAFVRALRKIYTDLGRPFPMLTNYSVSIPPGGRTDAFVQTIISWNYAGVDFKTRGLDADQTEAAIKATLKMLNKIEQ